MAASGVQTYYSVTAVTAEGGSNQYRVSAINTAGTGDPSTIASVTPPVAETQPAVPTAVTAMANGSTEINLSWTAGDAGASAITGYKIEYSKDNTAAVDGCWDHYRNHQRRRHQVQRQRSGLGHHAVLPGVGDEHRWQGPGFCHPHRWNRPHGDDYTGRSAGGADQADGDGSGNDYG